jgi:hypothetical protein
MADAPAGREIRTTISIWPGESVDRQLLGRAFDELLAQRRGAELMRDLVTMGWDSLLHKNGEAYRHERWRQFGFSAALISDLESQVKRMVVEPQVAVIAGDLRNEVTSSSADQAVAITETKAKEVSLAFGVPAASRLGANSDAHLS